MWRVGRCVAVGVGVCGGGSHSSGAVCYRNHSVWRTVQEITKPRSSNYLLHITPEQAVCGEAEKKNRRGSTYDDTARVLTMDTLEPPLYIQDPYRTCSILLGFRIEYRLCQREGYYLALMVMVLHADRWMANLSRYEICIAVYLVCNPLLGLRSSDQLHA